MYARQAGPPSDFADVTVDFEPQAEGVACESAADLAVRGDATPEEACGFQAAVADGIREEPAALETGTTVAVAVILRAVGIHAAGPTRGHSTRRGGSPSATPSSSPAPRPGPHESVVAAELSEGTP